MGFIHRYESLTMWKCSENWGYIQEEWGYCILTTSTVRWHYSGWKEGSCIWSEMQDQQPGVFTGNVLIFEDMWYFSPVSIRGGKKAKQGKTTGVASHQKIPECHRPYCPFLSSYRLEMHLILFTRNSWKIQLNRVHVSSETKAGGVERDPWSVKHVATSGTCKI